MRSSDRVDGRASLNPASVYLDIAAGWKVNSGKDSECTSAPAKPETRALSWCQASQEGISGLRSALCVTSVGVYLQRIGTDYWSGICSPTPKDLVNTDPDHGRLSSVSSTQWGGRSLGPCQQWKLQFTSSLVWVTKEGKKTQLKGWTHEASNPNPNPTSPHPTPPANIPSRFYVHEHDPAQCYGNFGNILINSHQCSGICVQPLLWLMLHLLYICEG